MKRSGFTLFEVLIVIAITTIVAATGWAIYPKLISGTNLTSSVDTATQAARQAVLNSVAGRRGQGWGLLLAPDKVTIYAGSSYDQRVVGSEQNYSLSAGLTLSGPLEYSFAALTGRPLAAGTTILTLNGLTKGLTINSIGVVE
jgi:prepilin-type N-terminal cleavage/methylation domain-containing protein